MSKERLKNPTIQLTNFFLHQIARLCIYWSNQEYFLLDEDRVRAYQSLDRSMTRNEVDCQIPIGKGNFSITYRGYEQGGVNDRSLGEYQMFLFPKEFHREKPSGFIGWSVELHLALAQMKGTSTPEFDSFFGEGKNILEVGSGQAMALLQLAQMFPEARLIGVDVLYREKVPVFLGERGVQLTHGDWEKLKAIPTNSIDSLLSYQAISMWGLSEHGSSKGLEERRKNIFVAINRVAKVGCQIRMDNVATQYSSTYDLCQQYLPNWIWSLQEGVVVGTKKSRVKFPFHL